MKLALQSNDEHNQMTNLPKQFNDSKAYRRTERFDSMMCAPPSPDINLTKKYEYEEIKSQDMN